MVMNAEATNKPKGKQWTWRRIANGRLGALQRDPDKVLTSKFLYLQQLQQLCRNLQEYDIQT